MDSAHFTQSQRRQILIRPQRGTVGQSDSSFNKLPNVRAGANFLRVRVVINVKIREYFLLKKIEYIRPSI